MFFLLLHVRHPDFKHSFTVTEQFSHHIQASVAWHIQLRNSWDYEIRPCWVDITCRPVYILAVQAGCSGVSGPISLSIQGEQATETSTRQGNRTGYAKYSILYRLVIQLLLTIGSPFRDLIHKERVGDILGIVQTGICQWGGQLFPHTVAIVGVGLVNYLNYFCPDGKC